MNPLVDDSTRSVEERLFIARELLLMQDKKIAQLEAEIATLKSTPTNRSESDLPWEYNRQ